VLLLFWSQDTAGFFDAAAQMEQLSAGLCCPVTLKPVPHSSEQGERKRTPTYTITCWEEHNRSKHTQKRRQQHTDQLPSAVAPE
jgi:hypothetical protein